MLITKTPSTQEDNEIIRDTKTREEPSPRIKEEMNHDSL